MKLLRPLALAIAAVALLASPRVLGGVDAAGTHVKGEKPLILTGGSPVSLADYLVPGKTTVFDFFSEYCPPCRAIAPRMEQLHQTRADIAVVKVNINRAGTVGIDWSSPVARQYQLESIPHFKIFGPDGKLKAEGDPAYEMVMGWLN